MHKLLSTPFYVNLRINVYFIHFVYILGKARLRWRTCGPKNQSMGSFWHAVRSLKDTKHICKYTDWFFFLNAIFVLIPVIAMELSDPFILKTHAMRYSSSFDIYWFHSSGRASFCLLTLIFVDCIWWWRKRFDHTRGWEVGNSWRYFSS